MDADKFWKKFSLSGRVEDYLRYRLNDAYLNKVSNNAVCGALGVYDENSVKGNNPSGSRV